VHDALYAELARGIDLPETGEGKDGWSFPLVNYLPVASAGLQICGEVELFENAAEGLVAYQRDAIVA
jgi:hypothetical protein